MTSCTVAESAYMAGTSKRFHQRIRFHFCYNQVIDCFPCTLGRRAQSKFLSFVDHLHYVKTLYHLVVDNLCVLQIWRWTHQFHFVIPNFQYFSAFQSPLFCFKIRLIPQILWLKPQDAILDVQRGQILSHLNYQWPKWEQVLKKKVHHYRLNTKWMTGR